MGTTDDPPRRIRTAADWGRMIKEARKRQGLTQPQLAGASGTSIGFLVDLERGKETAQLGLALHVAAMLGIHITAGRRLG